MPFGMKPVCFTCKTTVSAMWRKGGVGEVLCNSCGLQTSAAVEPDPGPAVTSIPTDREEPAPPKPAPPTTNGHNARKGKVGKQSRGRSQHSGKSMATKGRSQRVIFKKNPIKSAAPVATIVTSDYMFYDGIYYQCGDIVSLMDHSSDVYYAQIRGLLQDQYCEKSAVITWLLPTRESEQSPPGSSVRLTFDPNTYILGPEEDQPRLLEYMQFVCHAPTDYFKAGPMRHQRPEVGYLWTRVRQEVPEDPTTDQIFGPVDNIGGAPSTVGISDTPSTVGNSDTPSTVGTGDTASTVGIGDKPSTVSISDTPSTVGISDTPSTVHM